MSRSRTTSRRGSRGGWLPTAVLACLLLGGGTAAALWAAGVFDDASTAVSREGMVACPALSRAVTAYSAIAREDLIDAKTRQLEVVWVPEAAATSDVLRDLRQIVGRVARRDRSAGSVLTEQDFFPKGTRPGISAGVPPGQRAVTLSVDQIDGLELLRQGDAFDLVASLPPVKDEADSSVEYAVLLGGIKPLDTRAGQLARQSGVKPLVRNGTMIALTQGKSTSTSGQQGLVVAPAGSRSAAPKSPVATIAVAPEEITPLTEALSLGVRIVCITHSGHPEDRAASPAEPSLEGMVAVPAPVRRIEACSQVTQHDLADPVTGKLNVFYFPTERVQPEWLIDFTRIVGRVAAVDLEPGMILTADHFLPIGARPGLAAAIPMGRRAIEVPIERVRGLSALSRDDSFDILATIPGGVALPPPQFDLATLYGGVPDPAIEQVHEQLRSGLRRVVQQALLVRTHKGAKSGIAVTAVRPEEVVPLTQALTGEATLIAVLAGDAASPPAAGAPIAAEPGAIPFARLDSSVANTPAERMSIIAPQSLPSTQASLSNESAQEHRRRTPVRFVDDRRAVKSDQTQWPRLPVLTRPVAAHSELELEHFLDAATGQVRWMSFPHEAVSSGWEADLRGLLGRVAARDLKAGLPVDGGDLLPRGTRPGPTAGIPPGFRALLLDSRQVDGLTILQPGDRIDLVSADSHAAADVLAQLPWWDSARSELFVPPNEFTFGELVKTRVLARNALVVTRAVESREVTEMVTREEVGQEMIVGGTITRTGVAKTLEPRTITRQLVVATVAVPIESVTPVTEALQQQQRILAAARSGNPASPPVDRQDEIRSNEAFQSQQQALAAAAAEWRSQQQQERQRRADQLRERLQQVQAGIEELNLREEERLQRLSALFRDLRERAHAIEHIRGVGRTQEFWLDGERNPAELTFTRDQATDTASRIAADQAVERRRLEVERLRIANEIRALESGSNLTEAAPQSSIDAP